MPVVQGPGRRRRASLPDDAASFPAHRQRVPGAQGSTPTLAAKSNVIARAASGCTEMLYSANAISVQVSGGIARQSGDNTTGTKMFADSSSADPSMR